MYITVLTATMETLKNKKYYMNFNDRDFMHKWLTSQMNSDRKDENILYYMERMPNMLRMYIQTDHPFPLKNVTKAGFNPDGYFEITKPQSNKIAFNIFCSAERTKDGKKRFIKDQKERIVRMRDRLTSFMSDVEVCEIRTDHVTFNKGGFRTVPGSYFSGTGTITDMDAFIKAVNKGFGNCKNYGMGMLLFRLAG